MKRWLRALDKGAVVPWLGAVHREAETASGAVQHQPVAEGTRQQAGLQCAPQRWAWRSGFRRHRGGRRGNNRPYYLHENGSPRVAPEANRRGARVDRQAVGKPGGYPARRRRMCTRARKPRRMRTKRFGLPMRRVRQSRLRATLPRSN